MNYIIESIFVGLYACSIYLFFSLFIKNFYLLLFVCGFFKHYLGYYFNLWSWYCNNGNACKNILNQDYNYNANNKYLLQDSIIEGIIFIIVGFILNLIIPRNIYLFIIMGIILHIISEYSGIHNIFCKKTCNNF